MPEFNLTHAAILIVGIMGFLLGGFAYLTLAERKVAAWVQDRLGPNRVGPGGLLQPIADGGKFFLKEEIVPDHVDRAFYVMAPVVALGTAFLAIAVVPFGATTPPPDPVPVVAAADPALQKFDEQQADYRGHFSFVLAPGLDVGILYVFSAYTQIAILGEDLATVASPLEAIATKIGMPAWFAPILTFGVGASFFAVVVAPLNVVGRIVYVMGKEGVVAERFGRTHDTHLTPHRVLLIAGPAAIALDLVLLAMGVDPMDIVVWVEENV